MPDEHLPMSTIRLELGAPVTHSIRAILFHRKLSWGAKCLAMVLLNTPVGSPFITKKIARKMHSSTPQVSRWKRQLERSNMIIRFPKGEAVPELP